MRFQPLGGVAVIADNTWAAFQGRKKLKIEWDNGPQRRLQLVAYKKELQADGAQAGQGGRATWATWTRSSPRAAKMLEAEYYVPHLAHAPMEPPVAVAEYPRRQGDGVGAARRIRRRCRIRSRPAVGINKENVICHVTLLGGGFGRKSKPDYVRRSRGAVEDSSASR